MNTRPVESEIVPGKTPFAVFVLAPVGSGGFAATTRAADRGEAGKMGIPGGKVDPHESADQAALRKAKEEGWLVSGIDPVPFHCAIVDGKSVAWFRAEQATLADEWKERGRITPIVATLANISLSGYGNSEAVRAYTERYLPLQPAEEAEEGICMI